MNIRAKFVLETELGQKEAKKKDKKYIYRKKNAVREGKTIMVSRKSKKGE